MSRVQPATRKAGSYGELPERGALALEGPKPERRSYKKDDPRRLTRALFAEGGQGFVGGPQ
jgi:hypothetical protein